MKVLVDTSVWVDFFNRHPSPEAQLLVRLVEDEVEIVTCGVVIAEFFQGVRRSRSLKELERQFLDMECLAPREPESYFRGGGAASKAALPRDHRALDH